jgi:hypothetical protein
MFQTPFNTQWMPQQQQQQQQVHVEPHLVAARGSISSSKQSSFNDNHSHYQLMFDRQSSEEVRVSAQQRRTQQRSALAAALQASGPLKSEGLPGRELQAPGGQPPGTHMNGAHELTRAPAVMPPAHPIAEQVQHQPGNNRTSVQDTLMRITKVKWGSGLLPAQPAAGQAPHT